MDTYLIRRMTTAPIRWLSDVSLERCLKSNRKAVICLCPENRLTPTFQTTNRKKPKGDRQNKKGLIGPFRSQPKITVSASSQQCRSRI